MPPIDTQSSLRTHPDLADIFVACESRHLNEEEFETYLSVVPEFQSRANAAKEMKAKDGAVVRQTIKELYEIYPYEKFHQIAMPKCIRDVRYVTAYATQSMLMGDPDWFRDKLLIWLKTILQSFQYPDIPKGTTRRLNQEPEALQMVESLKPEQRSVYECYYKVKKDLHKELSSDAYAEMEAYLQISIDILSND
ncbi:MAG: hypothetical protein JJT75_07025 [Opitutales bacterium]|nr:hypothetical protein [Opitutales bacterium]MCH8539429.1 hypothetical protein [Opitutales bacterium]